MKNSHELTKEETYTLYILHVGAFFISAAIAWVVSHFFPIRFVYPATLFTVWFFLYCVVMDAFLKSMKKKHGAKYIL